MIITPDSDLKKDVEQTPRNDQQAPNEAEQPQASSSAQFSLRPLLFGYETQVKPSGEQTAHVCPKCKQESVFSSASEKQVIVMFIPVSSSATVSWVCTTEKCGWTTPIEQQPESWEPAPPPYTPPKDVDAKLVDV
ncbi:hypothetical protein B0H19DRAFT_1163544 [Mycena capillaripes]|nr:hypothetical protein B0H19DRAFT_1163544 [Mycena capillaripes]